MPRGRRVPRTPRVKKPKIAKIQRPKTKDLRMILKGLLTVSLANRIASLVYGLQWYDQALPYMVQKGLLTAQAKKLLEIAVKCRKQGIGTSNDDEKETAFLMALRQYEKACVGLKPPLVDKFFDQFKAKKVALEAKQKKLEMKFGNVVQLLQKAIGNRVKLAVADAQKPFQYDPGLTSVSYNREAAKQMALQFRAEGIFPVLVGQMDLLARHAALQPDGNGGWSYDPAKHVEINQEMLQSFITFAKSADAPNKLVRSGMVKPPKVHQPGTATGTAARQPRAPRGGNKTLGFLIPGTALHDVYDRLKDEKEHDMKDVIAGLNVADPMGRIKRLNQFGLQQGKLSVSIAGNKVQLKHTGGQP